MFEVCDAYWCESDVAFSNGTNANKAADGAMRQQIKVLCEILLIEVRLNLIRGADLNAFTPFRLHQGLPA